MTYGFGKSTTPDTSEVKGFTATVDNLPFPWIEIEDNLGNRVFFPVYNIKAVVMREDGLTTLMGDSFASTTKVPAKDIIETICRFQEEAKAAAKGAGNDNN